MRSGRQRIDTATVLIFGGEGRLLGLQAKKQLIRPPTNDAVRERGRFVQSRPKSERTAQKLACAKAKIRPPPAHPPHRDASGPLPPATHFGRQMRQIAPSRSAVQCGGRWRKWPPFMFTAARENTQQYPYTVTLCRVCSKPQTLCVESTALEPLGNLTVIWVSCPLVGSVPAGLTRARQGSSRCRKASHEHDRTARSRLKNPIQSRAENTEERSVDHTEQPEQTGAGRAEFRAH